jgi:hypothetical protein
VKTFQVPPNIDAFASLVIDRILSNCKGALIVRIGDGCVDRDVEILK